MVRSLTVSFLKGVICFGSKHFESFDSGTFPGVSIEMYLYRDNFDQNSLVGGVF